MLSPKKVKRRKTFKGRMRGRALRGNTITYGDFGLVATSCGLLQIVRLKLVGFLLAGN